ncbi:hypothetical protein AB9K32_00335 [Allomuricauda sp. XS_ASV26]|uniref:hypothetical protein n=1 Tax=Allomuricauda sp. XS_ASV26 TaxID=3241292 RepID=UPI00351592A3
MILILCQSLNLLTDLMIHQVIAVVVQMEVVVAVADAEVVVVADKKLVPTTYIINSGLIA